MQDTDQTNEIRNSTGTQISKYHVHEPYIQTLQNTSIWKYILSESTTCQLSVTSGTLKKVVISATRRKSGHKVSTLKDGIDDHEDSTHEQQQW